MAKKKVEETTSDRQDDIGSNILSLINKQFKDEPDNVAAFLSDPNISDITDWIDTGSTELNLAVSNRRNGGWPVGRITEIYGGEASGKSLLAAYAIRNTQKKGGIGVYFDTEAATSRDFFNVIGVDGNKMLLVNMDLIEHIMESIENIVEKVRRTDKDKILTIVVDSIMGATTKVEMESGFDKDGWNTAKAIILSKSLRKLTTMLSRQKVCLILINQIRDKLGVTFGDTDTTAGGKAVAFHSSVRVSLAGAKNKKITTERNGIKTVIGVRTTATIKKNRCGPAYKSATFNIYFDRGIDDIASIAELVKTMGLVETSGAWSYFRYVDEDTSELVEKKFQGDGLTTFLKENPELVESLKNLIADKYIMKYGTVNEEDRIIDELITIEEED
mgnify:FL=1